MENTINNYFKERILLILILVEIVSILYILIFDCSVGNFITIAVFNLLLLSVGVMTCHYYLTKGKDFFLTKKKIRIKQLANPLGTGIAAIAISVFTPIKLYALASIIILSAIISFVISLINEKENIESKPLVKESDKRLVNLVIFMVIFVSCIPVIIDMHNYFLSISNTIYFSTISVYFLFLILLFLLVSKRRLEVEKMNK